MSATCKEGVALLAERYELGTAMPTDPPEAATSPRSSIEPPPAPDSGTGKNRSGSPEARPAEAALPDTIEALPPLSDVELGPVERTSLEALVVQARAADARGDEAECYEQLGEAFRLVRRAAGLQ